LEVAHYVSRVATAVLAAAEEKLLTPTIAHYTRVAAVWPPFTLIPTVNSIFARRRLPVKLEANLGPISHWCELVTNVRVGTNAF